MPMKEDRRGWGSATGGNRAIQKGPKDFFKLGDWNARCDQCYLKCKASEMFLRWDNARVCWRCMEIRNPQDFVRGVPDKMAPPWTRPTPPPTFVSGDSGTVSQGGQSSLINGSMINGTMIG